jgi:multidrug efflux pump subunit AcrB
VEISRQKLKALRIAPDRIFRLLRNKNLVVDGRRVQVGGEFVTISVTGEYKSIDAIGSLLISGAAGGADDKRVVYLKDIGIIRRAYVDPATEILRFDGKPAIGLAISTVLGGNVVNMGHSIEQRLRELEVDRPVGMELGVVSYQSRAVTESVNAFVINLVEAVAIVIVVLLIFMGLKSGMIIGSVLLITICGTFLVMQSQGITLERISLGALIIALGMLVDNAIVIVEGMLIRIQARGDKLEAAKAVVGQTMMPLLGATIIAVLAFAAIGTSQDSTGEYCRSLFQVLLISLMMSWITAVTITPLLCYMFLKAKPGAAQADGADAYGGLFFRVYRGFLSGCIRVRWVTMAVMAGLLVVAGIGFGHVEQSFFPVSTRPQFQVDVWMPKGTHIQQTQAIVRAIEKDVAKMDHVTHVASCIGKGAPRFILTYTPEKTDTGYALLLVDVDDYREIDKLKADLQKHLDVAYPEAMCQVKKFLLGPNEGGRIQVRFRGPSPVVLRRLAEAGAAILKADPVAVGVRHDWREKVKVLQTDVRDAQAQRAGVDRPDVADSIAGTFEGLQVGVYRERNRLLPIIARAPLEERDDPAKINDVQVWSSPAGQMIPLSQVVSDRFPTEWEDAIIQRRHRVPTVTVHADQATGNASILHGRIKAPMEKMYDDFMAKFAAGGGLASDYSMEWGGEYEDSADAQAALAGSVPVFLVMMVLIVIFLFNAIRQPVIIWLCVPLAIIGVTAGLLATGQPFGFMALLGMMSLTGMLIKNAIVLVDEIDAQIGSGKEKYDAIVDSAVSRVRPVMMAAATTVMGMTPLVLDAFYVSMAVTIMAGLAFAAVLTLIVVPVLYAIFFRVPSPKKAKAPAPAAEPA